MNGEDEAEKRDDWVCMGGCFRDQGSQHGWASIEIFSLLYVITAANFNHLARLTLKYVRQFMTLL